MRRDFGLEDGQGSGLGVAQVAAVVGREEALHVGGDGGGDEDPLPWHACCANGRDDGVLAFEGGCDGVYR